MVMKRENEFLYLKLANAIRDQILTGFIKPGQFLLSENELCRQYELSRSSVRKALEQLVEEGLIVKKVGQGTIVSPDLVVNREQRKTLKIMATSPSFYVDFCMPYILEAFRQKYPQVEVKVLSIPGSALRDSFETGLEMGFCPDLLFVADRQYHELTRERHDAFLDLRPQLAGGLEAVYPKLVHAFTDSGAVTGAPVSFSSIFLVYNPRMFLAYGAEFPHPSWGKTEFLASAKKLTRDTDGDGIADICGFSLPISLGRWLAVAIANGVRFQKDQDRTAITRTLSFFHDILFRYRVATLAVRSSLNSEAFLQERTGMVLTTTFELASWRHSGLSFEPLVAPLPFTSDRAPLLIANAFMLPGACPDIDLARKFLEVALSPALQEEIARRTRFLSVLQSVNEASWNMSQLQSMGLSRELIDSGYFVHELLPDALVATELEREMELFWAGLESSESFARRYFDIVKQTDRG